MAARHGVGASAAWVAGPLIDGGALWRVPLEDGGSLHYVVFSGNVGDDGAPTEVVELLRAGAHTRGVQHARARSGAR